MKEEVAFELELKLRVLQKCFCSKFEEQGKKVVEEIRSLLVPPLIKTNYGHLTTELLTKNFSGK
jgi:hypothetical protein